MHNVKKSEPLYIQVANDIRARFKYAPPGTKLPSREKLAEYYGTSVKTLRWSMKLLYKEGWVEVRSNNSGTFVK